MRVATTSSRTKRDAITRPGTFISSNVLGSSEFIVIGDQELPWSDLAQEVIDSLEPLALDKLEEELEVLARDGIELHHSDPPEALNYVLCLALRPVWRLGLSPLPADRQAFYTFNRALVVSWTER
jgi:hypothetical protein